jgi:ABC-2 type transport system ATP-binding protein
MLQRLGIADALVKDPAVLILDEPTTAIDPLGVVEILDLLRNLVRERGMAVLLSSHLLSQVQSVCDRVGIFAAGKLIGLGTVDELARAVGDDLSHVEVGLDLPAGDEPAADRAHQLLSAIPGVVHVERPAVPANPWRLDVRPAEDGPRVLQDVLAASAANGLLLTSVRRTLPSLDEIYRRAVVRAGATVRGAAA